MTALAAADNRAADSEVVTIRIGGEIMPGDDAVFASAMHGKRQVFVHLESPGGDVNAAMGIGRLIREHDGVVTVTGECYSACVLVFAGGVTRVDSRSWFGGDSAVTNIGIHRVYFGELTSGLSQSQVKLQYDAILRKVRAYLRDMNVAPEVVSLMQSVEPADVRLLTVRELKLYGLGPTDVVYNERMTADRAAELGLTSAEFRQRERRVSDALMGRSDECADLGVEPSDENRADVERWARSGVTIAVEKMAIVDCAQAIRYGISMDLYRKRRVDVAERCERFTDTDKNNRCTVHYMSTGKPVP